MLTGNWSFHVAVVGDVTGDGLDDLLQVSGIGPALVECLRLLLTVG